jgi:tripeptide aminopeptidase
MQMKQLFAVLSVFLFGASFAGQAYASSFSLSAPYERTYLKSSTPAPQAKLAEKYRAGMIPRFVKYVQIDSMSDNAAEWMTPGQEKMAQALYEDIRAFGFPTYLSEDKYIYVNIPSNLKNRKAPVLGLSAHYDTTPDIIGNNVKPQVIKNYDGQPITLKNNHVIDFQSDPYLRNMIGKTIVTSDGTTNLGADDKAGVTIVVTLLQTLAENPKMPHGPIQVVITPNEDVGRSAERLELEYYHPDYAYDFDGGVEGEVVAANFSADRVVVTARGVNGHQSYAAENGYRNSVKPIGDLIATAALSENLPKTAGEQGYLEPHHIEYNRPKTPTAGFTPALLDQNEGKRYLQRIRKSRQQQQSEDVAMK